jgi:hypothetical protein
MLALVGQFSGAEPGHRKSGSSVGRVGIIRCRVLRCSFFVLPKIYHCSPKSKFLRRAPSARAGW